MSVGQPAPDAELMARFARELPMVIAAETRSRGLLLSDFPRLTRDSHRVRQYAVMRGSGLGKVNLPATLKSFVQSNFPDFVYKDKIFDEYRFYKKIAEDLVIHLIFERIHNFGLGKTFGIYLTVGPDSKESTTVWCKYSIFDFFDREALHWTYGVTDDLVACLDEVAILLRIALPGLEVAWREFHEKGRSEALAEMPYNGPLTFLDAVGIARNAIRSMFPRFDYLNSAWYRPLNFWPRPDFPLTDEQKKAAAGGRLTPGTIWALRFCDVHSHRTVIIRVPFRGRLGFELSGTLSVKREGVHHREQATATFDETLALPMAPSDAARSPQIDRVGSWTAFADSPDVMRSASEAGGIIFCHKYPDCSISLNLNAELSEPPSGREAWHVRYDAPTQQTRNSLDLFISARTQVIMNRYQQG